MSKMRPQKMSSLRQARNTKVVPDEGADVCELLVAELQARRVRLQELLSLVFREAARTPAGSPRVSARTHSRRRAVVFKQIA